MSQSSAGKEVEKHRESGRLVKDVGSPAPVMC